MKSLRSTLLITFFSIQTLAFSQTLINSSFEDYTDGSVFGQDDWVAGEDNSGTAEITTSANYVRSGVKGLRINTSTAVTAEIDYQSFGKDESGYSSNVYLDFWVKVVSPSSESESLFIRVFDHLPDDGIRRACEIRMYPEGDIQVSDGGSKRDVSSELYSEGDWIRISLSVDYATFKYQTAINGTVIQNSADASEFFDFRESYDPADKGRASGIKEYHGLKFWYQDAVVDFAIDDIYIGTDALDDVDFTPPSNDRTITVEQPDKAVISLDPEKEIYQVGDVVSASVTDVEEHYKFNGWTGSFSGNDNPLTINVSGNVVLGADIIIDESDPPNEYSITINQPTGGTISVDPPSGPYYEGTMVEFEVVADIGYEFDSWTGISGESTQVEVTITEDLTVSANMKEGTFSKRTVYVTNKDELEEAVENMLPGDSIVLADGTYNEFNETMSNQGGTVDYPVYIIAENQGMAKITGKSNFRMDNCAYINIMGLDIDIDDKNNIFKLTDCNNVRISRNTVSCSNTDGTSKWIEIVGVWDAEVTTSHHNRVDHNLFEGKQDGGALFIIGGNSGENEPSISQDDRIDHNHFKNVGPRVDNEKETIRVGYSKLSLASSYTTIENNLFEECDGDPEIISVKSCDNYVRGNTFLRSLGTVSLRHGNRNEVSGNFFIGDGKTAEFDGGTIGCGGVRVYGKDHKIFNNYFEGLTGFRWDAACTLTGGDASNDNVTQDSDLTKHYRIENLEFTHNTLVNNYSDIEIGYRDDWSLDPKNVLIANNIIIQDENQVTTVHFDGRDNDVAFADNIVYTTGNGSFGDIDFTSQQATNVDPLLEKSDCRLPGSNCAREYANAIYKISTEASPAVDPTATNTFENIAVDIEGQPSVNARDIGADEYNGSDPVFYGLLDERHVGPDAISILENGEPQLYTVVLTQTTGGTISITPMSTTFYEGSTVTFTAIPDEGYSFSGWNGIVGIEEIQQVVIASDLTVSADFVEGTQNPLQIDESDDLLVFPNPVQDFISISGYESFNKYSITNLAGSRLKSGNLIDEKLDIRDLGRGFYILEVFSENESFRMKFVKK